MLKNMLYLFKLTKIRLNKVIAGEFLHGLLLAAPTGILLLIIWELFKEIPDKTYIWQLLAFMVSMFILQMLLARKIYVKTNLSIYNMTSRLRIKLGDHLQKLSLGFYKRREPGDLASIVLQDVSNIETILGHSLPNILGAILGTFFLSIFLLITDWKLALVLLTAIPLAYLFVILATLVMKKLSQEHIQSRNRTGSRFIEYVIGIRHLKAFNQTGERFSSLKQAFEKLRKDSIRVEAVPGPFVLLSFMIFELFFLLMVYYGLLRLSGDTLDIPALIAFLVIGYKLYEPLKLLMIDYAILRYMNVSLKRVIDLLQSPLQDKGNDEIPDTYHIEFKEVTFSYLDREILKNVSFNIPEKGLTALVGASGSGKTTIANLIARFWDVQQGSVNIGGVNVKDMSPQNVYQLISQVFQDVYLFDDTVYNNIKIGKSGASYEEIMQVAEKAQVTEFLNILPKGIETMVGEGGSHLSGGQKQRISIARAMLKDTPIILLDEATASLDPENEIYIQQAIQELVKEKTVVVIAHKLQTIRNANNIIVLENGNIAEQGTHKELLNNKGLYANYWNTQQKTTGWKLKKQVVVDNG